MTRSGRLAAACVAVAVLASPLPASQRDDPSPEDRLRLARDELIRLQREMGVLESSEQGVLADLERLETRLRLHATELEAAEAQAELLRGQIEPREERLEALRRVKQDRERWLATRVRQLYKAGPWSELGLFFGAGESAEAWERLRTAVGAAERDRKALREWRATKDRIERELAGLQERRTALAAILEEGRGAANRMVRERAERERTLDRIRDDRDQRARAVSELEGAARVLADLSHGGTGVSETAPVLDVRKFRGLLDWPLDGARVVVGFGDTLHPRFRTVVPHPGLDLDGPPGATFRAVFDGRVVYATNLRGYGLTALVDHGRGLVSVYAQASALLVIPGQSVVKGQALGRIGDPALRGSPGIYFELRDGGKPVDPRRWLRRR